MSVTQTEFGKSNDQDVTLFELSAGNICVKAMNRGATVTSIIVPDRNGNLIDVALGFSNLAGYEADQPYFGCTAGRYANRIDQGSFNLDGETYQLTVNDGVHHLHGGTTGLDKKVWQAETKETTGGPSVTFSIVSPDGEQGYPGELQASAQYTVTENDELRVDFRATTDKTTIVNITQHSYFNLAGHASGDVKEHLIQIFTDRYIPTGETLIPTGSFAPVAETPYDLRNKTRVGDSLEELADTTGGFDTSFVLKDKNSSELLEAAEVYSEKSGITLNVLTTQPGVHLYTANFLGGDKGKDNAEYHKHAGLCLETQHFPDSINQPTFPSVVLRPGEEYHETCIYKFSAE